VAIFVQSAWTLFRMGKSVLKDEFPRAGPVLRLVPHPPHP
jgi:hypothetical protein